MNNEGQGGTMKRRLRAYKKTVSIVNEKAIELYKGLGIEKKGFLLEGTDKESGQYTFMSDITVYNYFVMFIVFNQEVFRFLFQFALKMGNPYFRTPHTSY